MIHYILLSCLLSLLGGAIYFGGLRQRLTVLHAKYTLLAIIVLSWAIPLLVPSLPTYTTSLQKDFLVDYRQYTKWNVVDIEDKSLVACYKEASSSKEQCHCEVTQKSEIVQFQYNPYYNFLLTCKAPVFWFFVVMFALFTLDLLLKLGCLLWLLANSQKEKRTLANTTFYLLRPAVQLPDLAVSSFTLWQHYIIWTPELELQFDKQEQQAILLHEVAHLQQRDTWQQVLLYTLRLVWWMQPMYYWFKRELGVLNEYVADDFAAAHFGNPKAYAKVLVKAKELQLQKHEMSLLLAFAKGLFRQRVVRLVQQSSRPQPKTAIWGSVVLVVAVFWSTSMVALPFLQEQDMALHQYEILLQQSEEKQQVDFYKSYLPKELNLVK